MFSEDASLDGFPSSSVVGGRAGSGSGSGNEDSEGASISASFMSTNSPLIEDLVPSSFGYDIGQRILSANDQAREMRQLFETVHLSPEFCINGFQYVYPSRKPHVSWLIIEPTSGV